MRTDLREIRILLEFFSRVASPIRIEPFRSPDLMMTLIGAFASAKAIRLSLISPWTRDPIGAFARRWPDLLVGTTIGFSEAENPWRDRYSEGRLPLPAAAFVLTFIGELFDCAVEGGVFKSGFVNKLDLVWAKAIVVRNIMLIIGTPSPFWISEAAL